MSFRLSLERVWKMPKSGNGLRSQGRTAIGLGGAELNGLLSSRGGEGEDFSDRLLSAGIADEIEQLRRLGPLWVHSFLP